MSLHFTGEHEWIRVEGDVGTVGISNHAQEALGDIVFVEVPEGGRSLNKGDEAAVVESVKAASDVYSPIAGEVIEGNSAVADDPSLVNRDPEGEGWFFKIEPSDAGAIAALMAHGAGCDRSRSRVGILRPSISASSASPTTSRSPSRRRSICAG